MKRISAIFLQTITILIGIGVLTLLLWEPHLEGRNVDATTFEIYFKDPFLAYIYVAFIPFFVALYQALTLFRHAGQHGVCSLHTVKALRAIRYCAVTFAFLMFGAIAYLFIFQRGKDDIAGGVAMGLLIIFVSVVMVTSAAMLERHVRKVVVGSLHEHE